ncbi:glucose/galactose MFS transporter [Sporocytophaga myxococcoides]|uniref:glucose/galactose MFS transporter n=1 Tax=Sporocytophaga myxococcoides TaxID=153721 RepID=UPI000404E463|nr:glucose/galactose MFS transporter [Sporocytophaga myxococcoides]
MKKQPPPFHNTTLLAFSIIFFGWGLLTSLNGTLIAQLDYIFELDDFKKSLINLTFFGTYFFVSLAFFLFSEYKKDLLSLFGYKYLTVTGLGIAATGAYLFYPASTLLSFPLFMGGLFVLASGITLLQISANTYIVNLGSSQHSFSRLTVVQALNSLGATLGPILGTFLIMKTANLTHEEISLLQPDQLLSFRKIQAIAVQSPYWTVAIWLIILGSLIFFLPMPDLVKNNQSIQQNKQNNSKLNLYLAALGIFMYVGAEVTIGSNLGAIIDQYYPDMTSDKATVIYTYWALAMIGRFAGGFILQFVNGGKLLLIFALSTLCLLTFGIAGSEELSIYSLAAIGFFNSIMFPGIFASGLHKLGDYTGRGASLLIMGIAGGAIIPLIYKSLSLVSGLKVALIIAFICYVYIAYYGRYFQKHSEIVE